MRDRLAAAFSPLAIFNTLQTGVFRPDLAHMPPLLLITGDNDTTVRPRNSIRLAEAAPRADVVKVNGASHVDVLLGLGMRFTAHHAVLEPIEAFLQNLVSEGVHAVPLASAAHRRGA